VVVPGVAHHVTQCGTGRQLFFYTRGDRVSYLQLLKENSGRMGGMQVFYNRHRAAAVKNSLRSKHPHTSYKADPLALFLHQAAQPAVNARLVNL